MGNIEYLKVTQPVIYNELKKEREIIKKYLSNYFHFGKLENTGLIHIVKKGDNNEN